eukprot:TRINITY_DN3651_c0_g1_i1.p2 TRINITY_DN3651_c0_g1~~TRINITY_DN3651_c0_g1_i1.p2  ORF type:complete len:161 (+),score=36.01 TRINITY_DN3651_c0_g1_i1:54-485(+)
MAFRRTALRLSERQGVAERMIETVPIVGAPVAAFMNKGTFEELAELKKADDPAAAVTQRFIENQKKLFAWRISRLRQEWQEFQDAPAGGMDAVSPLILLRTIVLSIVAYNVCFWYCAGFAHESTIIPSLVGEPARKPAPLNLK